MKELKFSFILYASLVILFLLPGTEILAGPSSVIKSPNGKIGVRFDAGKELTLTVRFYERQVFVVRNPRMIFKDKENNFSISSIKTRKIDEVQLPLVREKRTRVTDRCNELTVLFRSKVGLIIRVYDDGFAYRFITWFKEDSVQVINENGTLQFVAGDSLFIPVINCRDEKNVDCFHTSFEEDYLHRSSDGINPGEIAYLPFYARTANGFSLAVAESDLHNYPGMFVSGYEIGENSLKMRFPAYPAEVSVRGEQFKQELVTKRAGYIARTIGSREYPWRVFILGEKDKDLVNSDMVYRLASSCKIEETDWIKPGKITDEWITNSILYGVDFKSGINTLTYKYYIDFARRFGLSYIFMDAGWSDIGDFTRLNPEVNLPEIIQYGKTNQVGIWLWTSALTLENNFEFVKRFNEWGIKGIMVDFMDREDQPMIQFQEKVARETAASHLMVLLHGASKPTGLRKAYPNVIIREGVMGHEFDKWCDRLTPEHNLIIPFTRMIAGPMDYEGGGMINAQRNSFRIVDAAPMTQGTRIHQLAMYVVYESPLQYLAGNICDYLKEPEYAEYYGKIPVVWDETVVMDGRISDYILVARRNGNDWWIGAMTDWTPRSLQVDLSFLEEGSYNAEIYMDGTNADVYASDYRKESIQVTRNDKLTLKMAPGGGWVAHFREL